MAVYQAQIMAVNQVQLMNAKGQPYEAVSLMYMSNGQPKTKNMHLGTLQKNQNLLMKIMALKPNDNVQLQIEPSGQMGANGQQYTNVVDVLSPGSQPTIPVAAPQQAQATSKTWTSGRTESPEKQASILRQNAMNVASRLLSGTGIDPSTDQGWLKVLEVAKKVQQYTSGEAMEAPDKSQTDNPWMAAPSEWAKPAPAANTPQASTQPHKQPFADMNDLNDVDL